jgi:hypothetical protein
VSCGSAWQRLPVAIPDTLRLFLVRSVDGCFQLDFDCCENGVLRSRRFPRGLLLEGWLADRTGKTLSSADRSQVIARADDRSVRRAASDESGVAIAAGNQRSRIISNTVKRNCSRQWASVSQTIQATARPVRTPRHVAGKPGRAAARQTRESGAGDDGFDPIAPIDLYELRARVRWPATDPCGNSKSF